MANSDTRSGTLPSDTTAKNKDTLYYYSLKLPSNFVQTGNESKPPAPKAKGGKRPKGPVEKVSDKDR